jgi:uncharacterized paraquat-inducible protein A
MTARNIIALVLVVVSFALLYPGLTQPLITISASFTLLGRTMDLFSETRSILTTIQDLHESGNDFVAGLILVFGVVVPLVKGLVLLSVLVLKSARFRLFGIVRSISKWAMNDVFVVAVYTAFLAGKANENLDAKLEAGFYYFTAYCLISLLALQVMKIEQPRATS